MEWLQLSTIPISLRVQTSSCISYRFINRLALEWGPSWQRADGRHRLYVMLRQVKSEKVIVNSALGLCNAANQFVSSITTTFQKVEAILSEQEEIEDATFIPATLRIHKFSTSDVIWWCPKMVFHFLLNGKEPCFTRKYSNKKRGGHVDYDLCQLHGEAYGWRWKAEVSQIYSVVL